MPQSSHFYHTQVHVSDRYITRRAQASKRPRQVLEGSRSETPRKSQSNSSCAPNSATLNGENFRDSENNQLFQRDAIVAMEEPFHRPTPCLRPLNMPSYVSPLSSYPEGLDKPAWSGPEVFLSGEFTDRSVAGLTREVRTFSLGEGARLATRLMSGRLKVRHPVRESTGM